MLQEYRSSTRSGRVEHERSSASHLCIPQAEDFEKCWPVMRKYLGDVRPSAMMLTAGLSDPRMKIEIQVTAYRGAGV